MKYLSVLLFAVSMMFTLSVFADGKESSCKECKKSSNCECQKGKDCKCKECDCKDCGCKKH